MTLPPVIRIFFAIDLPASIKDQVGAYIGSLKKKAKTNGIRWTRPENLHITLQFLPEVRLEHISPITDHVKKRVASSFQEAKIKLGEPHLFPTPFRPRVIVLDISPQNDLALLSELIGQGILEANYAIENRPFRAHLTLGRIKQPQGMNLGFISEFKAPEIEVLPINEVVLFRSEPQPEGSHYSVLERIHFSEKCQA